jgi:hypothetical protein
VQDELKEEVKLRFITSIRLENYNDFDEYRANLLQSEKYYSLLSIFEISLRNSIDDYFKKKISRDWLSSDYLHNDTKKRVQEAKNKILRRREIVTHDKIIAELPFGFWTSLFRKSYSNLIRIQDINGIFPNMPRKNVKLINRNILDKKLNHIRKFRNRVFHYERIINKLEYKHIEQDIFELLEYFDVEISDFTKNIMYDKAKDFK